MLDMAITRSFCVKPKFVMKTTVFARKQWFSDDYTCLISIRISISLLLCTIQSTSM